MMAKTRSKARSKSKAHTRPKAKPKSSGKPAKKPAKPPQDGPAGKNALMYGGFQLKLGDHDVRPTEPAVYGGMTRKKILEEPIKAAVAPGKTAGNLVDRINMVAALRDDL
jgi:hypothetical protein